MKQRTVWLGLALLALVVAACGPLGLGSGRYASNGERIYFTGTSANGRIRYSGGDVGSGIMGGQGMTLAPALRSGASAGVGDQLACADCHGPDGRGGPHVMHMTAMDAPDIRWSTLAEAEHGGDGDHNESGAMEHPPYDEETFKRAVTQGLDPGGEPFDTAMPRWRMSGQDVDDLLAFVKTLD